MNCIHWILGKTNKTVDVRLHCSVCFQDRPHSDARAVWIRFCTWLPSKRGCSNLALSASNFYAFRHFWGIGRMSWGFRVQTREWTCCFVCISAVSWKHRSLMLLQILCSWCCCRLRIKDLQAEFAANLAQETECIHVICEKKSSFLSIRAQAQERWVDMSIQQDHCLMGQRVYHLSSI